MEVGVSDLSGWMGCREVGVGDEAGVSGKGFPGHAVTFGLIPVGKWEPLKVIS